MTDQEHEQRDEETSEERETMKDLDVPKEQAEAVKGGVVGGAGDDDDDLTSGETP